MGVRIVEHPLVSHLMTCLRDKNTEPAAFRAQAGIVSRLVILEALRDLPLQPRKIETPLEPMVGTELACGLAAVPILRAGLGMLESALQLFPDVAVGYVGLERDHQTAKASSYYCKMPDMSGRRAICLDPMLATGGSASQAISLVKAENPEGIVMASIVAAPEGIERVQNDHPDVEIVTAALDAGLNELRYILPGLGDFGDRLYAT